MNKARRTVHRLNFGRESVPTADWLGARVGKCGNAAHSLAQVGVNLVFL